MFIKISVRFFYSRGCVHGRRGRCTSFSSHKVSRRRTETFAADVPDIASFHAIIVIEKLQYQSY